MSVKIFNAILLSICVINVTYAQSSISSNNIDFSIVCHRENILKGSSLDFVLGIKNKTPETLIVPLEFVFGPSNCKGCDIIFEILYCTPTDTINMIDGSTFVDSWGSDDHISVESQRTHLFTTSIIYSPLYFEKKGIYKIRFILSKNSLVPRKVHDIASNWVLFEF